MSVTGKSTLSLRKKDVREQKNLAIGFKKTMFAHKATAGETGIDLTALVTPPEMSGFVNPTVNEMLAAQAFFYRKNMTIVSSLRGALMDFLAYNVASSSRIDFNGFTAEEGEIFVGVIDYNARNGLQVVDASAIAASGTLAIGSTDFNVGTSFETNKFSSQQVGAVIVFRNGVQQFRNSNNSSVNLDGNYYEVDNGSGSSQVIRFNNAPVSQSDSILVVSNGAVAYSPDGSALQAIETLAGQIDAMVPTLAALAGVPENDFQTAPNNADLKSFGDTVLDHGDRITALETAVSPGFSAYLTAATTAVLANAIVPFNAVQYNYGNGFNTGTSTFTVPKTGRYMFVVKVSSASVQTLTAFLHLSVNGARTRDMMEQLSFQINTEYTASAVLDLIAGQTVTLVCGGNPFTFEGGNGNFYTLFQGQYLP